MTESTRPPALPAGPAAIDANGSPWVNPYVAAWMPLGSRLTPHLGTDMGAQMRSAPVQSRAQSAQSQRLLRPVKTRQEALETQDRAAGDSLAERGSTETAQESDFV